MMRRLRLEPLDAVIISPQVGHATLALEEDVIAFVNSCRK